MADITTIANIAYDALGADPTDDVTDGVYPNTVLNRRYPEIRDAALESHPWNFAIERTLVGARDWKTPDFGADARWLLPDGNGSQPKCLRLWSLNGKTVWHQRESGHVVTDAAGAPKNALDAPNDFSDTDHWTASDATVTADAVQGPTGAGPADTLSDAAAGARGFFSQARTVSDDEGYHLVGCLVDAGTGTHASLQAKLTGGTEEITAYAELVLATGVVSIGGARSDRIHSWGRKSEADGWYWLWFLLRNNATGNTTLTWEIYPTGLASQAASDTGTIHAVRAFCAPVSPLEVLYIRQETDVDRWSALFREAVGAALAAGTAKRVKEATRGEMTDLAEAREIAFRKARNADGQEGSPAAATDDELLRSRL